MDCEKLLSTIDNLEEEYLTFLKEVCDIESPTDYKVGVDNVGKYFIEKAKQKGWLVEVNKQEVSGNPICITMNPDATLPAVCFSGHMDTVHPLGAFGDNPTRIDGDIVYGPGVIDDKGGIVAGFMAMDALDRCGFTDRPIKLILQSDEENGSRFSNKTTTHFMAEKAKGCIAFLNVEVYIKNFIFIAMKGIKKYEYEITGKSVHSCNCYSGKSAILEAAHKIIELEKFKDGNSITCNCGLINGGVAENTVPDKCVFTADFRFKNNAQAEIVENVAKEIAEKSFVDGTTCKLTLKSWRYCMERTEQNEQLFNKIKEIYKSCNLPDVVALESNGAGDAADMTQAGIPCLDGFGTEGGKLHTVDEFMYKRSLKESAKRLATVAYFIK